jgi:NitT/TauT family transport system substrate-binding protein
MKRFLGGTQLNNTATNATPPRRRRGGRNVLVSGIVLGSVLAMSACGGGDAPDDATKAAKDEPTVLDVGYSQGVGYLPTMVAQDEGIFTKHKLKVNLRVVQDVNAAIPGLGKSMHILGGTPGGLLVAKNAGLKVTAVSGCVEDVPSAPLNQVYGAPGYTSYKQFEGKNFGVPGLTGTSYTAVVTQMLTTGVDPKKVNFIVVNFADMYAQLQSGALQGVSTLDPFSAPFKEKKLPYLGDPNFLIANPLLTCTYLANPTWASENKDAINRFVTALREADTWIGANQQASNEILAKHAGLKPETIAQISMPSFTFDTGADLAKQILLWIPALKNAGVLKEDSTDFTAKDVAFP